MSPLPFLSPLERGSGRIHDGLQSSCFCVAHGEMQKTVVKFLACHLHATFVKLVGFQQESFRCLWFKIQIP